MLFTLSGCRQNEAESNEESKNEVTQDFTKTFRGAINDSYKITLNIKRFGSELSGDYHYDGHSSSLKLQGQIDESGSFTLNEFNSKGSMTGIFRGKLDDGRATGQWLKPDGSKVYDFSFSEVFIKESGTDYREHRECSTEYNSDEDLIRTCFHSSYKSVAYGMADYKGRYTYSYQLYKRSRNGYLRISNEALFNASKSKLLQNLNEQIARDFYELKSDKSSSDCFDGIELPYYSFNRLGIEFDEDALEFHVDFGMPNYCLAVGGTTISIPWSEANKYIAH
jgi:hypothetical protein